MSHRGFLRKSAASPKDLPISQNLHIYCLRGAGWGRAAHPRPEQNPLPPRTTIPTSRPHHPGTARAATQQNQRQLCHLPVANPKTITLLMTLTARNTTRLIIISFFYPHPPSPKLGTTGTTSSHWVGLFCSAPDPRPRLMGAKRGEAMGGLGCLVMASQPGLGVTRHLQRGQRDARQVEGTGVTLPHLPQIGPPWQPKDLTSSGFRLIYGKYYRLGENRASPGTAGR